ncbi:MAG: sigma 54-interacting transcriptional regulator, partial [Bacteroidota bacterium]
MTKKKVLIVVGDYVEANNLQLIVEKAGYTVTGIAHSVLQALELVEKQQHDLALVDITLKGKQTGIDFGRLLGPLNIPFIFLSQNCSADTLENAKRTQPYGYLFKPYRTNDLLIAMGIAEYRHENHMEGLIRQQALIKDQLSDITVTSKNLSERLLKIGKILQSYLPFDYLGYEWYGGKGGEFGCCGYYRVGFDEYEQISVEVEQPSYEPRFDSGNKAESTPMREPVFVNISTGELGLISKPQSTTIFKLMMKSLLMLPLDPCNVGHFRMYFASRQEDLYKDKHRELAVRLQNCLTECVQSIISMNRRVYPKATDMLSNSHSETEQAFPGIIGDSHLLLHVFDVIKQVAPIDSTVLILGESGTGKEKIAESIHRLSSRKEGPFVRINCAGFAPSLIESELFGFEKGAFTGAMERRIGKFEQANRGTIFLDEVGEMPMESQVKFLRVLQERQIERIGARTITPVDIRIIAATNRNLERDVAEGLFRLDLYYRLNVFPIELPALRDRVEDIAKLARHFIALFRQRTGRKIWDIHSDALAQLEAYHWPGNIRELEHVMERSLVLCRGKVLEQVQLPAGIFTAMPVMAKSEGQSWMKSLKDHEKEYLTAVIKSCDGRLSGKNGAATILGIPST